MLNPSKQNKSFRRYGWLLGAACVIVVASQWRAIDNGVYEMRRHARFEAAEQGKGEKRVTGLSLKNQTIVSTDAVQSLAAAGYDSERVWSGWDDWEPIVVTRPNSADVWQLTTRYNGPKPCKGCPFPVIVMRKSTNGGATWGADQFAPITKNKQNDPEMQIATDGKIYLAWIDGYTPGVRFSKSSDGGATWSTPLQLTPRGAVPDWSDKPLLVMSANGQHIYMGFNASDAYVRSSHDYGATWSTAVKTNNDTRYWFHTGGAVAPNGDVYFITSDFSQDYLGDANIRVLKSVNGGASWTTTLVDTSKEMPDCPWAVGCTKGFFGTIAGLAIDSAGKIMIGYNANRTANMPMRMFVQTSSNGGTTWSGPVEISGAVAGSNHHSVQVAAGTSGKFAVVWQDDRMAFNSGFNAYMNRTSDGGATWTGAVRLSDTFSGAPYKSTAGHAFPYGDYLGVSFDSAGKVHAIWGEGLSYTGPGGTWYTKTTN